MKSSAEKIIHALKKNKLKISFAESCTGGLLANTITSISGSSKVFDLGLIVYSIKSKVAILKISKSKIDKYGSVSKQICLDMVRNVKKISNSDISVSITGIAGPSGGTKKKPVGLVYVGLKKGNKIKVKKYLFKNKSRIYIQRNTVNKSLKLILSSLK